jgi:hypothetical protein
MILTSETQRKCGEEQVLEASKPSHLGDIYTLSPSTKKRGGDER